MSGGWLEELLPRAIVSPRSRILWLAFLLLFPLAYWGGVMLQMAEERQARVMGALDRGMSIKAAQQFAESKGISVTGWTPFVIVETHHELLSYYEHAPKPGLATINSVAPAREVTVLLRSPDQSSEFRAYLSLNGQVTGFDLGKLPTRGRSDINLGAVTIHSEANVETATSKPGDKGTEAIARRFLADHRSLNEVLKLGAPSSIETNSDDSMRTEVHWETNPKDNEDLTLHTVVAVRDGQVVAHRITSTLANDYSKIGVPKEAKFPIILDTIWGFFLTFSVLYAIFRYAKRTFQKEVSHLRTFVVAALFAVSYSVFVYSLAVDQIATRISAGRFSSMLLPAYVSALLAFAIMGLLVGIAYGSGEGEVREAYPGKLTPLDALLAGRLFSRDVATSVLYGAAAAGWLLLIQHAIAYFLPTNTAALRTEGLRYTFARLPWLTLAIGRQYETLLIAVAGLLLPASFLLRSKSRGKRSYAWLLLFALCSVLHDAAGYPTVATSLLAMAILVSALLLPFFAFDLLAAMVSLSALTFVNELAEVSAIFPSWIPFALGLAAVAAGALAVATYLAVRGAPVREEDVRPLYAKNLAERMGMQAEVLAAREAQLRLLPQAAPQIPGMEFAAVCLPAKGVGGDFYDFFQLDGNRIGIFVAQGGERGLASALCIALAKGLLMHASQQTHSAAQIVVQLEAGMAKLLQGDVGTQISFVYGVIDSYRQILNYARVGASPKVMVHRQGGDFANAAQLERLAEVAGRAASARPVYEGAAHLGAGDHLIFFTEGVTSLRLRRFGNRPHQWLEVLMRELGKQEEPLQTALAATLAKYQNHAAEDLTAVVLRAAGQQALRKEGVA